MLTGKMIAKAGVIIGSSLFGSRFFATGCKSPLAKVFCEFAGLATGGLLGYMVADAIEDVIIDAMNRFDEGEKETVNNDGDSENEFGW